jgi:CubicO group peptidase (beta-lactamase class C family)
MYTQRLSYLPFVILLFLVACGAPTVGNAPTPPGAIGLSPTVQPPRTPPSPTPAAEPSELPAATLLPSDVISTTDAFLKGLLDKGLFSGSVLIARKGELLVSKGYGLADREKQIANTPQTKFDIASLTKQFTAVAILQLQQQGKLNVQDPICKYIADCPAAWQPITIHQLLTHTSGFPDSTANRDPAAIPAQTVALIKNQPLEFKPGEKHSYTNANYIVLSAIIEQVSGKSYEAFLQEHILTPLKMQDTGVNHAQEILATGYSGSVSHSPRDNSNWAGAASLYSTVEDLYRWDQALYTDQLISKELRDQMFTPFVSVSEAVALAPGFSYGYGWSIGTEVNHPVVSHRGRADGFITTIIRFPDDKVTIIVLSNQEYADIHGIGQKLAQIVFGEK